MKNHFILFILLNSSCLILTLRSIKLNMYMTSSFNYCMKYLTKNSISGCSSEKSGNRGLLINITSLNDLKSYNNTIPIIVLIPGEKDLLEYAIFHSPMIVGILIDGEINNLTNKHFTEVNICPENYIGSTNCLIRKNSYGIDFRNININKPIFLLNNQTIINQLKQMSYLYNQQKLFKDKYIHAQLIFFLFW